MCLSFGGCNILSVPICYTTRREHEGRDTARLPKRRQGKLRGRGQVGTTDISVRSTRAEIIPGCSSLNSSRDAPVGFETRIARS
ncbi:hypothetical protein T265_14452, partial [Opisthorchis viverrini]